ncbi:archaetidylserine decarboxylase [Sporosarcina cascadiensis]|uniref:archaetidylserine decarboxylase n=1 Tax=Sporosarcina cascadiensis TaxID=2660747 RepID=UPI00129A7C0C|nr:archaetidylserine decarboxylase [Sporosarcina cascadiensis]
MKKQIFKSFVELTSHPVSSAMLKQFTTSRISKPLIRPFASFYDIQLHEAEYPVYSYKSLNDFFTRSLQPGSRTADSDPAAVVSPVDGVLSCAGPVSEQQKFIVKEQAYSLTELFGDSASAQPYENGYYYLFYLSPRHYHHFHYPVSGRLLKRYALGTASYPVNDLGIKYKEELFSSNYRIISEIDSSFGRVAVVKVGALNVNSIRILDSSKDCVKGEDFGHFAFGSTVILFFENKKALLPVNLSFTEVRTGDKIGEWQF